MKCAGAMIVHTSLEKALTLLLRGRLVPIATAKPGGAARLRDEPLELVREFGVEISVSLETAIITIDVVDVELGALGPLGVSLEQPMIVFHITLAQCDPLPDEVG